MRAGNLMFSNPAEFPYFPVSFFVSGGTISHYR